MEGNLSAKAKSEHFSLVIDALSFKASHLFLKCPKSWNLSFITSLSRCYCM